MSSLAKRSADMLTKHYFRALGESCRRHDVLAMHETEIVDAARSRADRMLSSDVDDVGFTGNLHRVQSALAISAYKALLPRLNGNQVEAVEIMRRIQGDDVAAKAMITALAKGMMFLSWDKYATAVRQLKRMSFGYVDGYETELVSNREDTETTLRVHKCYFREQFEAAGVPELTRASCCSLDTVWFNGLEGYSVSFEHRASMADDDDFCELTVSKRA